MSTASAAEARRGSRTHRSRAKHKSATTRSLLSASTVATILSPPWLCARVLVKIAALSSTLTQIDSNNERMTLTTMVTTTCLRSKLIRLYSLFVKVLVHALYWRFPFPVSYSRLTKEGLVSILFRCYAVFMGSTRPCTPHEHTAMVIVRVATRLRISPDKVPLGP